jgi:hypothetical protein
MTSIIENNGGSQIISNVGAHSITGIGDIHSDSSYLGQTELNIAYSVSYHFNIDYKAKTSE